MDYYSGEMSKIDGICERKCAFAVETLERSKIIQIKNYPETVQVETRVVDCLDHDCDTTLIFNSVKSCTMMTSLVQKVPGLGVDHRQGHVACAAAPKANIVLPTRQCLRQKKNNRLIARAQGEEVVDATVSGLVRGVETTADVVKQGLAAADKGASVAMDAYSKVAPVIEQAAKSVAPIVKDAVDSIGKPLASSLASQVSKGISQTGSLIEQAGVSPTVVKTTTSTVSTAVTTAKPFVSSAVDFVTTTPPLTLAEYAAGAAVFALAFPSVASLVIKGLRGYAGSVSPAIVLDKLSTSPGNVAVIDIRSVREKEASGLPDMRDKSRYIQLEFASLDDGRVRRELKNVGKLEVTMTALQIAALKKISKSTELYIMDRNGSINGAVAKQVAARGFSKVYVVKGGFAAWQRERLPTRLATSVSNVEVVAPGAVLFGSTKRSLPSGSTKKALPLPGSTKKLLPPASQ